jgi:hypothetical protein
MKKQIIKNLYKDKNISKYLNEIKENYRWQKRIPIFKLEKLLLLFQ